jgi:hypothetical protein
MSITPTAIVHSASPRPYAAAPLSGSFAMSTDQTVGGSWVCTGHMTIEHNPTATGSKRPDPGVLAGVLT